MFKILNKWIIYRMSYLSGTVCTQERVKRVSYESKIHMLSLECAGSPPARAGEALCEELPRHVLIYIEN